MRITTCETRTQLIVYSVSLLCLLACLFVFFVMLALPGAFLFSSRFFSLSFLVSFQRAVLEARSTMPMLPLLPSWANCLNGTGVDAFHDQI